MSSRYLFLIFFLVLISFRSSVEATILEGVVVSDNVPLEGAVVKAYASLQDALADNRPLIATIGQKAGFFRIDLPSGIYFLTASGGDKNRSFFAYHGANPITIGDKPLWLPFVASPFIEPVQNNASTPGIAGKVIYKGKSVSDAQVSLYPAAEKNIRGLGLQTKSTDINGSFSLAAPPGSYILVARKRLNGKDRMPLKSGDLFCFYGANPVNVEDAHEALVEIHCNQKDDQQSLLGPEMKIKRTSGHLERFRERIPASQEMGIAGLVQTLDGKPAENIQVTAYLRPPGKSFQMYHLRLASENMVTTDRNGRYSLPVNKSGSYYLVARQFSGEAPLKGELYGLYEGNSQHAVSVDQSGVVADITVGRVMAEAFSETSLSRDVKTNTSMTAPAVIERDTLWSGEVIVKGAVLVARAATLTLAPGTVIRFKRIDLDNDGIGDGELRVTGRIIARGTPEKPIRFISAEDNPRPGDWSYLLLFTSGVENVIENAIFEHAFTGLQVHFSRAVVSDSVFRNNVEGIRFGRAELSLEHNEIISNEIGIRYHRLEGPVKMQRNVITKNGVGLFLVPSSQQFVDFTMDTYTPDHRYYMHPLINYNCITGNIRYNYQLGERLSTDINIGENWWGSEDEAAIRKTIFDREREQDLGRVIIRPLLSGEVQNSGPRKRKK